MIEKKDEFIDHNKEKSVSPVLSLKQSLSVLKQEFQDLQLPTDTDNKLGHLAEKVSLFSELETAKIEELMKKHPELNTLMDSILKKINNNDRLEQQNDLLQQEKELLVDLWYSILASLHKQLDEEKVIGYTFEATTFYKKIPLINTLFEFLAKKAQM